MIFLPKLRKVDLSYNNIHYLPEKEKLAKHLKHLEFVMLHQNQIVGWDEMDNIVGLESIRHLTLQGNPCTKITGSREHIVSKMSWLWCLDEFIVQDFERKPYSDYYPQSSFRGERLNQLKRFKPFSTESMTWKPWTKPMIPRKSIRKASISFIRRNSIRAAPKEGVDRILASDSFQVSTEPTLISQALQREHYALRRKFESCSPIVTIQKNIRMWLAMRAYKRKRIHVKILYWGLRRHYKRIWLLMLIK